MLSRIASRQTTASTPPAPAPEWPTIDLIELIGTFRAISSPRASLIAAVSALSFRSVDVPWALM